MKEKTEGMHLVKLIVGGSGLNVRYFVDEARREGYVVMLVDGGAQVWSK